MRTEQELKEHLLNRHQHLEECTQKLKQMDLSGNELIELAGERASHASAIAALQWVLDYSRDDVLKYLHINLDLD